MATEKAVITQSHLTDIANAIIAKGGATGPLKPREMKAAIEAIPSGGDPNAWSEWFTPPSSWPHLPNILKNDREEYIGKMVVLWSIEVGLEVTIPNGGQKVVFGDGTIYTSGFGGKHTFSSINQKTHYAIVYSNVANSLITVTPTSDKVLAIVGNKDILVSARRFNDFYNNSYLTYIKANADGARAYGLTNLVAWELPDGVDSIPAWSNQFFHNAGRLIYLCKISGVNELIMGAPPIRVFPDEFNMGSEDSRTITNLFGNARFLRRLPSYLCANCSISFINCPFVEKDSVAEFDDEGRVVGGFVKTLRSWDSANKAFLDVNPIDGKTITLNANIKALFTETEQTAIADCLTSKNWGLVW